MGFEFAENIEEWTIWLVYIMIIIIFEIFGYKRKGKEILNEKENNLIDQKYKKKVLLNNKQIFVFLWICLSLCIIISKLFNKDDLNGFVFLFLSVPIFFVNILPKIKKYREILYSSSFVSYLPFLIVLFYIISRDGRNNVIGVLTSFVGTIVLMIINDKIQKKYKPLFISTIGFVFLILIFINGSRAGLLSFLIVLIYIFFKSIKEANMKLKGVKILIIQLTLTIILIPYMLYYNEIFNLLFNKWDGISDVSSGREIIWLETIEQASWIGYGENYYYQYFYIGDAHNIFIQVLGQYGVITLCMFLIIILYLISLLIKINSTNYNMIFISYLSLGLFENVLFIDFRFGTITFIMWYFIGLLLNEKVNINIVGSNKGE
jgi:hypothetical protein